MIKTIMFLCMVLIFVCSMWALEYGTRVVNSKTATINQLVALTK